MSSDDSIVSADVGQKALRALLSAVHGGGRKRRSENGSHKRKGSPNKVSTLAPVEKVSGDEKAIGRSDDLSLPSIREQGKAALDALLSRVALVQREDDEDKDPVKASPVEMKPHKSDKPAASRKRSAKSYEVSLHSAQERGKAALDALFSQAVASDQGDDDEEDDVFNF
jgi:hypothetical protein